MFDLTELPAAAPASENRDPDNIREMPGTVRSPRAVTNLAKVFGQFAHLQHQVGEQVCALEESVGQQRQEFAADLAEMKRQIHWLIRQDENMQARMARNEADIRALSEDNAQWTGTLDQIIELLVKARGN